MNTETSENETRADILDAAVDLTPEMINQIYRDAEKLRGEAMYDVTIRAYRAARSATSALYRLLFASEARRHA